MSDLRLRLEFEACVGATRLFLRRWFLPKETSTKVSELTTQIAEEFGLGNQELTLTLKGFQLDSDSPLTLLRDDDIISVSGSNTVQIAGTALDISHPGEGLQLPLRSQGTRQHVLPLVAPPDHAAAKRKRDSETLDTTTNKRGKPSDVDGALKVTSRQQQPAETETSSDEESSDGSETPRSADAATPVSAGAKDEAPASAKGPGQSRNARRKKAKRKLIREGVLPKPARKSVELPQRVVDATQALPPLPKRGEAADASDPNVAEFLRTGHVRFDDSDDEAAPSPAAQQEEHVENRLELGQEDKDAQQDTVAAPVLRSEEVAAPSPVVDFDALPTLASPPQPGDVLAYKLLEISASLTPEVSEWRCGKVTEVHPDASFALEPWPDKNIHPTASKHSAAAAEQGSEEYEEEEEDAQQASQYDEDGVLQADMTSFLDLRAVQKASGHAAEAQTAEEAEIHADPAGDGQALAAPVSQYEAATAKAPALSTPGMLPRVLRRAHPRGDSIQQEGAAATILLGSTGSPSPTPVPINAATGPPSTAKSQQPSATSPAGASASKRPMIRPIPRIQRGVSQSPAQPVASQDAVLSNGSAQIPQPPAASSTPAGRGQAATQTNAEQDEILAMIAKRKAELAAASTPSPVHVGGHSGQGRGQGGEQSGSPFAGVGSGGNVGKTGNQGANPPGSGTPGSQGKFKTRLRAATLGRFLTRLREEDA